MKKEVKILLGISLFLICLCGCDKGISEENAEVINPNPNNIKVWDVEPVYEYDDIVVDFDLHYPKYAYTSRYLTNNTNSEYDVFEEGGVIVYKNGYAGILDREGNIEVPVNIQRIGKLCEKDDSQRMMLDSDYNYYPELQTYWSLLNSDYSITPTRTAYGVTGPDQGLMLNEKTGELFFWVDGIGLDGSDELGSFIELTDINKYLSNSLLVNEGDPLLVRCKAIESNGHGEKEGYVSGYVFVWEDRYVKTGIAYDWLAEDFSSGIARFTDSEGNDTTYVNMEGITIASGYEDGDGFYEGLAPVKKNGKWGYINETGEAVIDFIFDKATTVSDGKAWVIYNGRTGRLNIKDMLDNDVQFVDEVLNINGYETVVRDNFIEVTADVIKKRVSPSTEAESIYKVVKGDILPYFEKVEAEGYTWYRIGTNCWIADKNGEWVKPLR